jgi:hypothetical protein
MDPAGQPGQGEGAEELPRISPEAAAIAAATAAMAAERVSRPFSALAPSME